MATATESTVLEAQPRIAGSKNDARRVRREGKVPGVLYGAGKQALSVSVDPRQISRILRSASGHNTIFELSLDGAERSQAMIVDWQYEPIKGSLLHIDLKRIAMDKLMKVQVPVVLDGIPVGVKMGGGILDQVLREVEIECLPADIPSHINLDVTNLAFGDVLRVSDLPHGGKFKFLDDENATIAHVVSIKAEVEPTVDAVAAAVPAEPEVVKKGKQDADAAAAAPAGDKKAAKK
jgi:large subunit ribosomal protein L25